MHQYFQQLEMQLTESNKENQTLKEANTKALKQVAEKENLIVQLENQHKAMVVSYTQEF